MYYDLHIHSALSPCGDDDMTLNNIVNMAFIKELELIAITDHNSVKQLKYLPKVAEGKIDFIYGVEIQSREEVHILAYFLKDTDLDKVQSFLDKYLIEEPNDEDYFGHQYILNDQDEIIGKEDRLLLKSVDLNIYEVVDAIHELHGIAVLAHANNKRYSIMSIYYEVPEDLDYDAIEVSRDYHKDQLIEMFPYLKDKVWLHSSDAHQLDAISEPLYQIDEKTFYGLWEKRYG